MNPMMIDQIVAERQRELRVQAEEHRMARRALAGATRSRWFARFADVLRATALRRRAQPSPTPRVAAAVE